MTGMTERDRIDKTINKIINTPVKTPSRSEAKEILRNCGILNENDEVSRDYKDIFIEVKE